MAKYDFQSFYKHVCYFNQVAGKSNTASKKELLELVRLIEEEVKELREAVEQSDATGIVTETVDTAVTLFGFIQNIQNLGFDFFGAAEAVTSANFAKFTPNRDTAEQTVIQLKKDNPDRNFRFIFDTATHLFVILDDANKVRKPISWRKADTSIYAPSDYEEIVYD